jgi:hypothetical protein
MGANPPRNGNDRRPGCSPQALSPMDAWAVQYKKLLEHHAQVQAYQTYQQMAAQQQQFQYAQQQQQQQQQQMAAQQQIQQYAQQVHAQHYMQAMAQHGMPQGKQPVAPPTSQLAAYNSALYGSTVNWMQQALAPRAEATVEHAQGQCVLARMNLAGSSSTTASSPRTPPRVSWRCAACKRVDHTQFMLKCDGCGKWLHGACGGVASVEDAAALEKWHCRACEAGCTAQVRGALDRLISRVEREAERDALKAQNEVRRAVDRLLLAVERQARKRAVAAPDSLTRRLSAGPHTTQSAGAGSSSLAGPTVLRPADDGTFRYVRRPVTCARAEERTDAPCALLELLTPDCLECVLAALPLPVLLLSVVSTCRRLAQACEPLFAAHCDSHGWRLGRLRRGATSGEYAWRSLLRASSCAVCTSHAANYPVRRHTGAAANRYARRPSQHRSPRCPRRRDRPAVRHVPVAGTAPSSRKCAQRARGGARCMRAPQRCVSRSTPWVSTAKRSLRASSLVRWAAVSRGLHATRESRHERFVGGSRCVRVCVCRFLV